MTILILNAFFFIVSYRLWLTADLSIEKTFRYHRSNISCDLQSFCSANTKCEASRWHKYFTIVSNVHDHLSRRHWLPITPITLITSQGILWFSIAIGDDNLHTRSNVEMQMRCSVAWFISKNFYYYKDYLILFVIRLISSISERPNVNLMKNFNDKCDR